MLIAPSIQPSGNICAKTVVFKSPDHPITKSPDALFFRWHVEIHQVALEASGFPGSISDAQHHPERAKYLSLRTQADPKQETNDEPQDRRNQLPQSTIVAPNVIV